ncbi:hypothetical protein BST61_g7903 [Cercospora zeina]
MGSGERASGLLFALVNSLARLARTSPRPAYMIELRYLHWQKYNHRISPSSYFELILSTQRPSAPSQQHKSSIQSSRAEIMQKVPKNIGKNAVEGSNHVKFTNPKVSRGKSVWPSGPSAQAKEGVRYDYDGVIVKDGVEYHEYNMQPNAGKDGPSAIQKWRDNNGGTHAIMTTVLVKKDGTKEDVERALEAAHKDVSV